jgi:hypothetical protein
LTLDRFDRPPEFGAIRATNAQLNLAHQVRTFTVLQHIKVVDSHVFSGASTKGLFAHFFTCVKPKAVEAKKHKGSVLVHQKDQLLYLFDGISSLAAPNVSKSHALSGILAYP